MPSLRSCSATRICQKLSGSSTSERTALPTPTPTITLINSQNPIAPRRSSLTFRYRPVRGRRPTMQRMSESAEAFGALSTFGRLLRMLRPHAGIIAIALALLLLSMPAELFPAFIWMYVTDYLILQKPTTPTTYLHQVISFGGRLD